MPSTPLSARSPTAGAWRSGVAPAAGALLIVAAIVLRLRSLPFVSSDMERYLLPWYSTLLDGGAASLGSGFSDYPPAYLYLLFLAGRLHEWVAPVVAIKSISIVFDVAIGALTYLIVRQHGRGARYAMLGALASLVLPTVWLNSARWGQCDSIYSAFLLACVYCYIARQPFAAMLSFSFALSFKLQAVFLVPFLAFEHWRRGYRLRYLALPVGVCLVLALPALYAGRSVLDLLAIYPRQVRGYTELSIWAPSVWGLCYLTADFCRSWSTVIGVLVIFNAVGLACAIVITRHGREILGAPQSTLLMATASALVVPFLLPRMHERYFFTADVLSFILALCVPQLWYLAAGVQAASVMAYGSMLFGWSSLLVPLGSVLNGACIVGVLVHLGSGRRLFARSAVAGGTAGAASPARGREP
ncbi:MAG: hypothetical protein ACRERC_09410 [Candidatus Binatia bacterium]